MAEFTSRGPIAENTCILKHLLLAEGHAEEMIANASRANDEEEILVLAKALDDIRNIRQILNSRCIQKEMNAISEDKSSKCPRCSNELIPRTTRGLGNIYLCPKCLIASR